MNILLEQRFIVEGLPDSDRQSKLVIEDKTNYSAIGINPADVSGVFTIHGPGGILYSNDDIEAPDTGGVIWEIEVGSLPEDVHTDLPIQGQYIAEYSIRFPTRTYDIPYQRMDSTTLRISANIEVMGTSLWVVYDGTPTEYTISAVTPVDDDYQDLTVTVAVPEHDLSKASITLDAAQWENAIKAFQFQFKMPSMQIAVESECDLGIMTVADETMWNYPTISDTRSFVAKYPESMDEEKADIEFSNAYKVIDDLYTGVWVIILKHDVVFVLSDKTKTYLEITISKAKTHNVDCSTSLCSIADCYKKLIARTEDAECNSSAQEYSALRNTLNAVTARVTIAGLLKRCGLPGYTESVAAIKSMFAEAGIMGCGCDDDDGFSRKVSPLSSILPGGSAITLSSVDGSITITIDGDNYDLAISEAAKESLQGADGTQIHWVTSAPTSGLGVVNDIAFQNNGAVWVKTASNWEKKYTLVVDDGSPQPEPPAKSLVSFGPTVPDNSVGSLDDVFILTNPGLTAYKKDASGWIKVRDLNVPFRPWQDNGAQNPIEPNKSGDEANLYYLGGHDVCISATAGNTFTVNRIDKIVGANPTTPAQGEELRVFNKGPENVTFVSEYTPVVGSLTKKTLLLASSTFLLEPNKCATFKYISTDTEYYVLVATS